jgi:hypothetical protein
MSLWMHLTPAIQSGIELPHSKEARAFQRVMEKLQVMSKIFCGHLVGGLPRPSPSHLV